MKEARLNLKLYLLILVEHGVPQRTSETVVDLASLCALAVSKHRQSTKWRHSPDPPPPTEIKHENNSIHGGKEER